MLTTYTHKNLTWVDLLSPSKEEIRDVVKRYGVHPDIGEELLSPTAKPTVELYTNSIFLILHFPAIKHTHSNQRNQEVDFIIGTNFLITVRYDTVDSIHKFSKEFEVENILNRPGLGTHAGTLFFRIIQELYAGLLHELEYVESSLENIEKRIFTGEEKEMVKEISDLGRHLLDFEKSIISHREALDTFEVAGKQFFGDDFSYYLRVITNEYKHVLSHLKAQRAFLTELRETNNSLLSTKQNEVMKVLTILAFVTFPLSLVASIFGMNTVVLPLVGLPHDFWIVMGVMGAMTLLMLWYFTHKKWL